MVAVLPTPFLAGMKVTADGLNAWLPIAAIKTTAQTVNNSTTLVDDTVLQVTLPANCTYRVEVNLGVNGATAADIAVNYVLGGTLAGAASREFFGPETTGGSSTTSTLMRDQMSASTNPVASAVYSTAGVGAALYLIREILWLTTGASGGTLKLQCAQSVATASDTTWRGTMVAERKA